MRYTFNGRPVHNPIGKMLVLIFLIVWLFLAFVGVPVGIGILISLIAPGPWVMWSTICLLFWWVFVVKFVHS